MKNELVNESTYNSYAGFTIGPIFEVLSHARKTREIWFSSYFFSWFMESLIERLHNNRDIRFLTPHVPKTFAANVGLAGKYHDRFILASGISIDETHELIKKELIDTLGQFVDFTDGLAKSVSPNQNIRKDVIKDILGEYLQFRFVILPSNAVSERSAVPTIDEYLDSAEQFRSFALGQVQTSTCDRCKTLPSFGQFPVFGVTNGVDDEEKTDRPLCPICFLKLYCNESEEIVKKLALPEWLKRQRRRGQQNQTLLYYPPVLEIASAEFLRSGNTFEAIRDAFPDNEDYDFERLKQKVLNNLQPPVETKTFHKYIAVVATDGDSIGEYFKNNHGINSEDLSERLFRFAEKAEACCNEHKGQAIYIGGDDLLAFMPVVSSSDKSSPSTILNFVRKLSDAFSDVVNEGVTDQGIRATLSFGVNIVYYKYPLARAIERARELLYQSKSMPGKNYVTFSLTKHSGSACNFGFPLRDKSLDEFGELFRRVISKDVDLPHGVHHNIGRSKVLLTNLGDDLGLAAFFEKNFSEHAQFRSGLHELQTILSKRLYGPPALQRSVGAREEILTEYLSELYFMNFLRGRATDDR